MPPDDPPQILVLSKSENRALSALYLAAARDDSLPNATTFPARSRTCHFHLNRLRLITNSTRAQMMRSQPRTTLR
jgi:hypothetical protein